MMKKIIISFLGVISVLTLMFGFVYAWTFDYEITNPNITGKTESAYFESGDGSESSPYIISNKVHLYNFAWLQYLGMFNDEDTTKSGYYETVYFKLKNDIDCDGLYIPAIGTTAKPFVGVFDGNGCVISNINVTNNYSKLDTKPGSVTSLSDASIIGFFGVIGKYDSTDSTLKIKSVSDTDTTLITSVSNFYLENISINVTSGQTLAGIIAGYVNANISNIGVEYSSFDFATQASALKSKISNYALIGDYNSDDTSGSVDWNDKPDGGNTYGTSTDLQYLYEKYGNNAISKGKAYPFRTTASKETNASAKTKKMTLSAGQKDVTIADTLEASTSNIGYYVGADVKFYNKSFKYSEFYYPNDSSSSTLLTDSTTPKKPTQEIIDYLNSDKGQFQVRLTGSEIDIINEGGLVVVENGKVGEYSGDVLLPQRSIWVAPTKAGTLKFVATNVESGTMGIRINKLTRSTPGDYSSYFTNSEQVVEKNAVLLGKMAYYFEIEVSENDIKSGYEYAVTGGNNYKTYISYIDLGTSAAETTTVATISNIDFVYKVNGSIVKTDDSGYSASNVLYSIEGTTTLEVVIYYRRIQNDGVLYYYESIDGLTMTTIGSGSTSKASSNTCESKES